MDSEIFVDEHGRTVRRSQKVKDQGQKQAAGSDDNIKSIEKMHARPSEKGNSIADEALLLKALQDESAVRNEEDARRPCPVPKPKGVLGRLLGFDEENETKGS